MFISPLVIVLPHPAPGLRVLSISGGHAVTVRLGLMRDTQEVAIGQAFSQAWGVLFLQFAPLCPSFQRVYFENESLSARRLCDGWKCCDA